jgi:hypothetical protein
MRGGLVGLAMLSIGACATTQTPDAGNAAAAASKPARIVIKTDPYPSTYKPLPTQDVVIWSADPFSVYALAETVFVDGAVTYDRNDPTKRPVADFELGQPGEGDDK